MKRGVLRPGGTVVEGTAGNTGIGLALVANAMGFKTVIVIPETQSQEKKDAIAALWRRADRGAGQALQEPQQLREGFGPAGREAGEGAAGRRDLGEPVRQRRQPAGAYRGHRPRDLRADAGQGRRLHLLGRLGRHARRRRDGAQGAQQDDPASASPTPRARRSISYYTSGELKSAGNSITEGIGQGRITANLKDLTVDHAYQIPDSEALPYVFDLLEHEGLCLGGSSGINIAGAVRMARDLGPGKTIVTVLCDYGNRYQSKLFNPAFLKSKGLPVPHWLEREDNLDWRAVLETEPA